MSVLGTTDAPLDVFGGLVTDMAPADLPAGASPDCADVAFLPGAVKTRPGLASIYTPIAGNPTVNYLKTFVQPNLSETLLALDSAGTLWGEFSPGALTQIAAGLASGTGAGVGTGARACSTTLFGREYLAFSDGKFGVDLPRQFDGTNFDRVSQCGPGAGPQVVDANAELPVNIAAAPTGAARASGIVTITTTVAHGYTVGTTVTIAGVTDSGFDGLFVIAAVPTTTSFTYLQLGLDTTSGSGTVTMTPQISAGVHQLAVFFQTRQGYLTRPSPPVSWTSAGGLRALVTNIPIAIGDSNIVARILAFTAASGDSFFYTSGLDGTPNMILPDNFSSSALIDFSDTVLLAGAPADQLFRLVELGECAGVIGYASRLFWWGERNNLPNLLNLSFDGGVNTAGSAPFSPLGWTSDATFGPGGVTGFSPLWGGLWTMAGDGIAANIGMIEQSAYQDFNGVSIVQANTSYSVRIRARLNPIAPASNGNVVVDLQSTSLASATGLTIPVASLTTSFQEFTGVLTTGYTAVPSDLLLRAYASGTPNLGGAFDMDTIEVFPTAQPFNASVVRASLAEDPESYDGVSGLLSIAENNGQAVRAAFVLRDQLYFVKEHSIYSTQDDGVNEPSGWTLSEVSRACGTPSVQGVDTGEGWAVIADRSGLYIFDGGEPVKLSQEIQPLWDTINWQYGHTLWVRVDMRSKRILVGVPIGAATQPDRILVLDYRGLSTAAEIASFGSVHMSSNTGRFFGGARGRRWAPWNIVANSAALAERSDGTAQLFLGNGASGGSGNGKIYQLSDTQFSDDGAAIGSYYTTYFLPSIDDEQQLQTRAHRKLFSYLTCYVEGAGNLSLSAFPANEAFPSPLPQLPLTSPARKDLELPINVLAERAAFQVSTNQAGAWFRLSRLVLSLAPDPWSPVRGGN